MKTAIVVLAAGASSRMGQPKQLLRVGGQRLLDRALHAASASKLAPVIIVLGANAQQIQQDCNLSEATVVINEQWLQGMATSLQAGIRAAAEAQADAAVVMTADMPFVDGLHLRALADKAEATQSNVASFSDGWRGIPACFLRASFPAIAQLQGDTGGRALLLDAPVVELPLGMDVDTPEELHQANNAAAKIET